MFPDSFALQDCLPNESVAKRMLTKEKNDIWNHRNSETHVIMKYESLSYLTLSAGNWQNPQKIRMESSLLDIKKAYSFISCACHLTSINVHKRLKSYESSLVYNYFSSSVISKVSNCLVWMFPFSTFRRLSWVERKCDLKARQEKKGK